MEKMEILVKGKTKGTVMVLTEGFITSATDEQLNLAREEVVNMLISDAQIAIATITWFILVMLCVYFEFMVLLFVLGVMGVAVLTLNYRVMRIVKKRLLQIDQELSRRKNEK